jgi:calcineurin-like phosphoesterase family protein
MNGGGMVKGRPKYWFTSDTHFGHKMVAGLRDFKTSEHEGDAYKHDEEIIERWNDVVAPDDIVFHLGDVGLGDDGYTMRCVSRLNGQKHLITGNHDKVFPGRANAWKHQDRWSGVFRSIQQFAVVKLGYGGDVVLSHFPYEGDHTEHDRDTQWRLPDEGKWLLHGHLHVPDRVTNWRSIHVGLDAWGLQPVPEHEVVALMKRMDDARQEIAG